jgi:hypothetical protein
LWVRIQRTKCKRVSQAAGWIGCKTIRQRSFYTGPVASVNTAPVLFVSLFAHFATMKLCNEAWRARRKVQATLPLQQRIVVQVNHPNR